MRNSNSIARIALCLPLILANGCANEPSRPPGQFTREEAAALVVAYLVKIDQASEEFARENAGRLADVYQLVEITTPEIWKACRCQLFATPWADFLVADGTVSTLGGFALGYKGMASAVVCDLDADGASELAVSYSRTMGRHESEVAVFFFDDTPPRRVAVPWRYGRDPSDGDLLLTVEQGKVSVWYGTQSPQKGRLGELVYSQRDGTRTVDLKLDPELPSSEPIRRISSTRNDASVRSQITE
jgi:hypothetical protein